MSRDRKHWADFPGSQAAELDFGEVVELSDHWGTHVQIRLVSRASPYQYLFVARRRVHPIGPVAVRDVQGGVLMKSEVPATTYETFELDVTRWREAEAKHQQWRSGGARHWQREGVGYVSPTDRGRYHAETWDLPASWRTFGTIAEARAWLDRKAARR